MAQRARGANLAVVMVNYRVDEMKDDVNHGVLSMIIWEHLEPIGKFEKTIVHFFLYGTKIVLHNIELKHPF
jgi:hypothetical protein